MIGSASAERFVIRSIPTTPAPTATGPREPPSVLRSMIGRNSLPSNTERLGPISSELTPGGSPAAAKRAAGRVQFRLARVSAADSNLVSENPKRRR